MGFGGLGALGAVGGILQSIGSNKQTRSSNKNLVGLAQSFAPSNINNIGAGFNPFLYRALGYGGAPTWGANTGLQNSYNQLVNNPGYIDPTLKNAPYTQATRGAQANLARFSSMIGRSGAQGGLAQTYGLSNLAALTGQRAQIAQQYALWREQQRRADMDWLSRQLMGTQGQALGANQAAAGYLAGQQPTMNWAGLAGNAIQGFLGAFGGGGGITNGYQPQAPPAAATQQTAPWASRLTFGQDPNFRF